ncbi:MAG: hypothetical protein IPL17_04200 [Anaerolineales bacterium]|nr:hypothetical protein [Anaerolineales bacterium]
MNIGAGRLCHHSTQARKASQIIGLVLGVYGEKEWDRIEVTDGVSLP